MGSGCENAERGIWDTRADDPDICGAKHCDFSAAKVAWRPFAARKAPSHGSSLMKSRPRTKRNEGHLPCFSSSGACNRGRGKLLSETAFVWICFFWGGGCTISNRTCAAGSVKMDMLRQANQPHSLRPHPKHTGSTNKQTNKRTARSAEARTDARDRTREQTKDDTRARGH